ncbi:hypothetical protein [Helicobacter burdigaliensis]|uniref:hypothetical protein n=1 Tax=Helicobacter burdigaliensis TaxID=2315334 RepID=UPI001E50D629|nr:hypothetical protein [Helicobacter burdigaliensis]
MQTSKDLFQVASFAGISIVIFILIQHSLQTRTIPFVDSQKAIALAITGILFGGIFSFFYMGIFSFSRELYKQYFKMPITIPLIIYIASTIVTFITLQKPSILLLISIVIVFIVANVLLYFFGRKDRVSLDKFGIFTTQTILILIIYVAIAITGFLLSLKPKKLIIFIWALVV